MKVLIIGGTGTMGRPLVELLAEDSRNQVSYISRKRSGQSGGVSRAQHLVGSVLDDTFMNSVLDRGRYDCIIDFMWYTETTFLPRYEKLLNATNHYIGMSSGAVCADSDIPITEDMPRVIDICSENERKSSHEYHLEKARIEDILMESRYHNWTLVRPHVTFNVNRLPLFVWEKEQWLYRVLQGHTLVLTKDMLDKKTVLTYGKDVARGIIKLIGNQAALGEIINITSGDSITRRNLIDIYQKIFRENFGIEMKIIYLDNINPLKKAFPNKSDRMDNDRMLNRVYDISKFRKIVGNDFKFSSLLDSLLICCRECVKQIDVEHVKCDGLYSAYMDRMSGEKTSLNSFDYKNKIIYILARSVPSYSVFVWVVYKFENMKSICKKMIKKLLYKRIK